MLRKECLRCGHVSTVSKRVRRCRQAGRNTGAWSSFYCWGQLRTVAVRRGDVSALKPQDIAAARATKAQKRFDDALASILRSVTSLKRWQAQARHWSRRAAMTDEQLQAERDRRKERVRPGKRGIAKGGL